MTPLAAALVATLMLYAPGRVTAAPAQPITTQTKTAPKTLPELIELAMKEGQDSILPANMAEKLGYAHVDTLRKRLRYRQTITPDKEEHTFSVVIEKHADGTITPIDLNLSVGKGKLVHGIIDADLMYYRASLQGTLQKAYHNKGKEGDVESTEVSIISKKTKKQFAQELSFYLHIAPDLNLQFAK